MSGLPDIEDIEFLPNPVAGSGLAELTSVSWFYPEDDNDHDEPAADIIVETDSGAKNVRRVCLRFWNARFLSFDPYASWFVSDISKALNGSGTGANIRLAKSEASSLLSWWRSRKSATDNKVLSFDCHHYIVADGTSIANVLAFGPPEIIEPSYAH